MTHTMIALRYGLIAVVAGVLMYSGVIHALQPYLFLYSAASYRIMPTTIIMTVMSLLPYLHIVTAICILIGCAERTALGIAAALFAIYAAAQGLVLYRGEALNCGCFGYRTDVIDWWSLAVPIACGCAALFTLTLPIARSMVPPPPSAGA